MLKPDIDDIDKQVLEDLERARQVDKRRREMKSGQIKKTLWGDMKFVLLVDLPADMPEDNFKKYMAEYGKIVHEAFSHAK